MSNSKHQDDTAGIHQIPRDLLEHIFILLPVKSLLWLRSVCRSWNSMITSLDFKQRHYSFHLKLGCRGGLLQLVAHPSSHWYSLLHSTSIRRYVSPSVLSHHFCRLVGVANGIVLIWSPYNSFALWNPATGKYLCVPPIPSYPPEEVEAALSLLFKPYASLVLFGFTFDPTTQDYKVVLTMKDWSLPDQSTHRRFLYLYSSVSASWKFITAKICLVPKRDHALIVGWSAYSFERPNGSYINGKFYWLAHEHIGSDMYMSQRLRVPVIIVFDFEAESYTVTPLPEIITIIRKEEGGRMTLVENQGSLMLLTTYLTGVGEKRVCDIWVMIGEDDCGTMLWESHYSFHFNGLIAGTQHQLCEVLSLTRILNGELGVIFEFTTQAKTHWRQLVLYVPSTETYTILEVGRSNLLSIRFDVVPYVESLFCVKGNTRTEVAKKSRGLGSLVCTVKMRAMLGSLKKMFSSCSMWCQPSARLT